MALKLQICIYTSNVSSWHRVLFAHKSRFPTRRVIWNFWIVTSIWRSYKCSTTVAVKSVLILQYVFQNTTMNVRRFFWFAFIFVIFIGRFLWWINWNYIFSIIIAVFGVLIKWSKTCIHTLWNRYVWIAYVNIKIVKVIVWFYWIVFLLFTLFFTLKVVFH